MAAGAMTCLADVDVLRGEGLTDSGMQVIGLFQTQGQPRRVVPAFALSTIVHTTGIFVLSYALLHAPRIEQPARSQYKVRHLELHQPETAASRTAGALYPTSHKAVSEQRQE